MTMPKLPSPGSQEYLWWKAGTDDEAKARDEGLGYASKEVRDVLEGLARLMGQSQVVLQYDLVLAVARIYCPQALKRRHR